MNPRATWSWIAVAAGLFAFIFFLERHVEKPPSEPQIILPALKAAAVTSIQILPKGQLEIRLERTNDGWQLTRPIVYPAKRARVEVLLRVLERLAPATLITAQELKGVRRVDEKFGFEPPQYSVVIQQGEDQTLLHVGFNTAPGDQVFFQVVGIGEVYVVDAALLKLLPAGVEEWRERQLLDLAWVDFDRVLVTNACKAFELQRDDTNHLWRMILPGWEPRADSGKVEEALRRLHSLQITQYVSDDPRADLDSFGLQSPELSLSLALGTNTGLVLEFGMSPTNDPGQIYARRADLNSVVTVSKEALGAWSYEGFRDRHLVSLAVPLTEIEVHGRDDFTLQLQSDNTWRIAPQAFPVDTETVYEFMTNLSFLQVADFYKDVVTAPDLPDKGLAVPWLRYILKAARPQPAGITNVIVTQLEFGTNLEDRVFVRRTDENSLYTVMLADLARLPSASWELRDRRIWNFTPQDVAGLIIRQDGKTREIERRGTNDWALRPGSSGIIHDLAMDEAVHRLGELAAVRWAARGGENRDTFGFGPNPHQVTVELKTGHVLIVEFGGTAPSGCQYALTLVDNEPWVFEFPWLLYHQYVRPYFTIPSDIP